jgi:hypothetical protein
MSVDTLLKIVDPGNLTMEELEAACGNPHNLPLWALHPLVQHAIRVHHCNDVSSVERKCEDDAHYVPCDERVQNLLGNLYRIKSGHFNRELMESDSCFFMWQWHMSNVPKQFLGD